MIYAVRYILRRHLVVKASLSPVTINLIEIILQHKVLLPVIAAVLS